MINALQNQINVLSSVNNYRKVHLFLYSFCIPNEMNILSSTSFFHCQIVFYFKKICFKLKRKIIERLKFWVIILPIKYKKSKEKLSNSTKYLIFMKLVFVFLFKHFS